VSAARLLAIALGVHQQLAEAVQVCDRFLDRGDEFDGEARSMLEAMAVGCGLIDASVAPSMAGRADALIRQPKEQTAPRDVLAVAANAAAL
jgi:hypothetical protein